MECACVASRRGRELALADYIDACELNHELGCQNQKILEADGVTANVAARAKKASTAEPGRGYATGATTTITTASGTVHGSHAGMKANKDDL